MRFKTFGNCVDVLQITRPLSVYPRERVVQFVSYFNLPVWFDPTNLAPHWVRSRIRSILIPFVQRVFCPCVCRRIQIMLITSNAERWCGQESWFERLHIRWINWTAYPLLQRTYKSRCGEFAQFLKALNAPTNFLDISNICLMLLKIVK